MCGIAGLLGFHGISSRDEVAALGRSMAATLNHRGPDGSGQWVDDVAQCLLAHRRLAIVGLGGAGSQPMISADGRYVISYNGELYNHLKLRQSIDLLADCKWRGSADTETLLELIARCGLDKALTLLDGMYAFAVFDRVDRILWLVRDRFGEKPLYWSVVNQSLLFGSEIKALSQHPAFDAHLGKPGLNEFLRRGCTGGERTIYRAVEKVAPGGWLRARLTQAGALRVEKGYYWQPRRRVSQDSLGPEEGLLVEQRLDQTLKQTVESRLLAEVPVGIFLSGGIDSSLLACMVRDARPGQVSSFSIGFSEQEYNEAEHARRIANHLGLRHHELYITEDLVLKAVQAMPVIYDEPFADSSQVPTWLVSRLAANSVKVCLSGDGADELFGGYVRYTAYDALWKVISHCPVSLRQKLGAVLRSVPEHRWDSAYGVLGRILPASMQHKSFGAKVHKAGKVFDSRTVADFYLRVSQLSDAGRFVAEPYRQFTDLIGWPEGLDALDSRDPINAMMDADLLAYLPDDLLVKVDRAAMSCSLETRMPFLSSDVYEFSRSLPRRHLIEAGVGKLVLRRLLANYLPAELFERPKQGFAIPINAWLRSVLNEWANDLLGSSLGRLSEVFDVGQIRAAWSDHQAGRADCAAELWPVLMFIGWSERARVGI